jgi:protein-S-isoprenylcysteine O-methyltransferase Ste14
MGGAIMLAGIYLRRTAVRALGDGFISQVLVTPALRADGPYRRRRHPSELGLLLIAAGAGICAASHSALAVSALVLVPLVALRIRREERDLLILHGEAYLDYRDRAPALF